MQTLVSSFLGPLTCYLLMPTLVEVVNSQSVLCISWCQFIGYSRKLSSFYLWPSYSGGNEDNGNLLQKIPCVYCYTQCPQPCSRPPLTHTSAGDSWTLLGKSGSVSCGVTAPFSWKGLHGAKSRGNWLMGSENPAVESHRTGLVPPARNHDNT